MIKPSLKRKTLFHRGRPTIRAFRDSDIGFLWANSDKSMQPGDFVEAVKVTQERFERLLVIDDYSEQMESGKGPVALIGIQSDGWKVIPEITFFKWSSTRNKLAGMVALFRMLQQSKEAGMTEFRIPEKDFKFMSKIKEYGVVKISGKIPNASPQGAEYIFSIRGKKRNG